ncbi:hypothetical protein HYPBUDRAFT_145561 [Hyphopichia burtonii NRRL Y-1933]|uniref:Ino eighty subunit 1 n=1 Tax=Hyphopichia burtonii NRRL Y-1933 TaxID=984485 RepID=A0A1E4RBU5_9ASCO|nr:hypothetical protein HYPBUDRAFT_145561 [Hyphopichia burtonii NRRL Y-1933]ODV64739.1 hypothetical protein HYPBUDRAFT_145561 [Hyphopichia burtonii NRRL Y-1933]
MSYDPIHDTYVPSVSSKIHHSPPSSTSQASSNDNITSNHLSPNGNAYSPNGNAYSANGNASPSNGNASPSNGNASSPSRKALSIESLVSPANAHASILNPEPHDDVEEDEDDDDDDDDETKSKSKKKRGSASSPKNKLKNPNSNLNKPIRHLKKSDGSAFWRKDIQYDFLNELFEDENVVFTNPFPFCNIPTTNNGPKLTFSELYIRTLAESSKSSKILKERLIREKDMAKSVAKVCLLVNAGRMNTTINFVPEMRSSLRTYHSIPSLQADPVNGGSKPLQDTPRLKSILKAVCDGQDHIKTVGDIINNPKIVKPNTNVIQLIFLLSNHFHNIKYHYPDDPLDSKNNTNKFMEFFLSPEIHPKSRARRFLWLMYTYLETSFAPEELAANPFGSNQIPDIEIIPDSDFDKFDVDTDYEKEFSEKMYQTRLRYLVDEEHNSNPKRGNKSKKDREHMQQQLAKHRKLQDSPAVDPDSLNSDSMIVTLNSSSKEDGNEKPTRKRGASDKPKQKRKVKKTTSKSEPTSSQNHDSNTVPNKASKGTTSKNQNKAKDPNGDVKQSPNQDIQEMEEEEENNKLKSKLYPNGPIDDLEKIFKTYVSSIPIIPLTKDSKLSMSNRNSVINKSKTIIRQVRNSNRAATVLFNKRLKLLNEWLVKFFQYKKSTHNGLLGMEWEDIRQDITSGIETYTYQQLGKAFTSNNDSSNSNNITGNIPTINVINSIHGSVGTVDYNNIDLFDSGYLSIHDFNHANEKNHFLATLLSFCSEWLLDINDRDDDTSGDVKLDLLNETINFD